MYIFKTRRGIIIQLKEAIYTLANVSWDKFINRPILHEAIMGELAALSPSATDLPEWLMQEILPPIGSQEVWAAGVTYLRSRNARMDEAKEGGGATFYDKVYDAERPELFFKATPQRVVGYGQGVRIRKDSTWNVPEPELTLFVTSSGSIEGYTIGNDMSSRSIEGENPLYLPQAKVYEQCAALGPCLYVPSQPIQLSTLISIEISRNDYVMYADSTPISNMKRQFNELVNYLFRECSFVTGCFLMTGTCLVPPNEFTLEAGDEITISIQGIGTLKNYVV
jgi:2-dehydro-3-deoxy-D-arabinonate dehydratase